MGSRLSGAKGAEPLATEEMRAVLAHNSKESGMPEGDSAAVERVIANTINETARGDPDALAARIVAALAEAGFLIVSASGRENTARGRQHEETRQLYRSPN